MNEDNNPKEYSGNDFRAIMTGDPKDYPLVAEYLNNEWQQTGANLRDQVEQKERAGEPKSRRMLPLFYGSTQWQAVHKYGGAFPMYTILGPVNLGPAELEWTLSISRCRFTDMVQLRELRTAKVSFRDCVFEKGITVVDSNLGKLEFSDIRGLFDLEITNSEIDYLIINADTNRSVAPRIINTKIKSLFLNSATR